MTALPLLERREIEARILAPVIEALAARFGREEVLETLSSTIQTLAREHGAQLARSMSDNSIKALADVLDVWRQGGALEADVVRSDEKHYDFDVTRCRFAEMYHRLGIPELGPILSCNRDFCFAEGFNPELSLTREKTIMGGASHCNFRFSRKEP